MRRLSLALLSIALVLALATPWAARSQAASPQSIQSALAQRVGKAVTLQLESGQELTGVVRAAGDRVVELEKLSGREFYDAYVDLEDVAAVIVRAR